MSTQQLDRRGIPGFSLDQLVRPECAPFSMEVGNAEAMLFIHGLTGSPQDFRTYIPQYFDRGYDVFVPLWPGHGSHISVLERLSYREFFIPFPPLMRWLLERYQKVHITALSYGSILAADLSLQLPPASLSFLAPAFFLMVQTEKKIALMKGLKMPLTGRVRKKKLDARGKPVQRVTFTYDAIPAASVLALHNRSLMIRPQLGDLELPIFHAHGDQDETTSYFSNHQFLSQTIKNYSFYPVPGGQHILPLDPGQGLMAAQHLRWLKGL